MKPHYEPQAGFDASGEWVWHFQLEARNLSSVAQLRKLIAEAFTQQHWRSYTTGFGHESWRECEFDYFLIVSDIAYRDMSEMFTWRDHGRKLADMMEETDHDKRRPLKEASADWHSPTMESLAQRAARLGWTSPTGLSVRAPAEAWAKMSQRARIYADHDGQTREDRTQQKRKRQVQPQRADLDRLVETLVQRVKGEVALRYVVDRLRERLPKVRKAAQAERHQQWVRDIATFKGNAKALAKHWGLTRDGAHRRIRTCRPKRRLNLQIQTTKRAS